MIILGIETSCDETAVCIIEVEDDSALPKIKILGNQLYSQVALHTQYGGVYPMMAKREHSQNLVPLLEKCLEESKLINLDKNKKANELPGEEKEKRGIDLGVVAYLIKSQYIPSEIVDKVKEVCEKYSIK